MKKIFYTVSAIAAICLSSCQNEGIEGIAVHFSPKTVVMAEEDSGTPIMISLEASGKIRGVGEVMIALENADHITLVPAPVDGLIKLIFNGTQIETISATVEDDGERLGYDAVFKIVSVAGVIETAGNDTFTIQVQGVAGCGEPIDHPDLTLPYTEDFEACSAVEEYEIPAGWIEEFVPENKTDRGWGCRGFGRNGSNAPAGSAFGGEAGEDNSWLIAAGKFDLSGVAGATLQVWVESPFTGDNDTIQILWSDTYVGQGNPECASWTALTDVAAQLPEPGSKIWTEVTSDLSGAAGKKIYLAFQYTATTNTGTAGYNIDDLSITIN